METVETVAGYAQGLVKAFKDNGISWCHCETDGYWTKHYDIWSDLAGATTETVCYLFESGQARKIEYCKEMLAAFHGEYTAAADSLVSRVYTDKETIKAVQTALNKADFPCSTSDDVVGKMTIAALTDYQTANGLAVTGTITHETLISMGLAA